MADRKVLDRLIAELGLPAASVESAAAFLEAGTAVPFIARYRRERTGGLNERQVSAIAIHLRRLARLEQRKATVLKRVEEQGTLPDELRARIAGCFERSELEDLYLPYRPKRRTRGTLAKERGLEPLAQAILEQKADSPPLDEMAAPYVDSERGVADAAAALEGARHIIAECVAERPEARSRLRRLFAETGIVRANVVEGKAGEPSKYETYYDFCEPARSMPSHRVLAIRRGEKEGWITVRVEVDRDQAIAILRDGVVADPGCPAAAAVAAAVDDAYDRLLAPAFESGVRSDLKRAADADAIAIFSRNLRNLLLQAPAGPRRTLGVNPGYRTGCQLAALDEQGQVLEHITICPHEPQNQLEEARAAARALIEKHAVDAIAIGNGTASRETDLFFRQLIAGLADRRPICMVVNDAGATVFAASRTAREEFPGFDPAVRAAASIGRRFQDPLAELVLVDPKMIGVGQYQHDVNQQALREALEAVVGSCVNAVGSDVNAAPAALLSYVAGLDRAIAHELVRYREAHGPFRTRAELLNVPRIDERQFEQAAPFLRIRDGDQPLDRTAIHPERYELVARIAADAGTDVPGLLGNHKLVATIQFSQYATDECHKPTLLAIRTELLRPGRDPRPAFRCIEFRDDVTSLEHLEAGMILEGTVTNVTNFGAFVDIGVHEDGLVHVSQLARRYVKDPSDVAHVGEIVRVKVLAVDTARRRISLSIKQALPPPKRKPRPKGPKGKDDSQPRRPPKPESPKRPPNAKATPEDIARLIAHFQSH